MSVIPGQYVTFLLDYPTETTNQEKLRGVSKISVERESEMLWNLNIEENTYDEVVKKLGKPTDTFVNEDGTERISYKGIDNHYAYFVFRDGRLIEHGLTATTGNPLYV